jgi:DNA-binding NarL/FixJ family response regulator
LHATDDLEQTAQETEGSRVATALRTTADSAPRASLAAVHGIEHPLPHRHAANSPTVRVLIADGQALVRAGLRAMLERGERVEVVGEAVTGDEAVALARRMEPDVALMDAELPGLESGEAIRRLASETGVAVMLLAASEDDERIFDALRAGAESLLLKNTEPPELVHAVEALARGEAVLSPSIARQLIAELAARPAPSSPSPELLYELTAREREIVVLVGHGLSNDDIAERLVVSPSTAKTHVSRAMVKLHAHDRAKLVVFAYETGLVAPRSTPLASVARPFSLAS